MALEYRFKPLSLWPRAFTRSRVVARFTSSQTGKRTPLSKTMSDLEREIRALNGRNVTIQVALKDRDIRLDGQIRADARQPEHPGVILSFDGRHGSMSFAQDKYTDWRDNLRSIALTLEALRAVDRYGVTEHGEQYQGFKALPSTADTAVPERSEKERAAATLLRYSTCPLADHIGVHDLLDEPEHAQRIYADAVRQTHPDTTGLDGTAFHEVQQAWNVLKENGARIK